MTCRLCLQANQKGDKGDIISTKESPVKVAEQCEIVLEHATPRLNIFTDSKTVQHSKYLANCCVIC